MTDRLKGCTVAFEQDIRVDDATALLDAIRMLRGVVGVIGSTASSTDYLNRARIRQELADKLFKVLEQ